MDAERKERYMVIATLCLAICIMILSVLFK